MITKERLEELIEQGATIWVICWGKVKELNLNDVEYMEEENGDIYYEIADEPRTTDLSHLFETKEDAEEYAEFGNITRTERLELPMWEEACDGVTHNVPFTTPNHLKIEMLICDEHIDIISIYNSIMDYSKPLTKENYNEARRLCVKLFKGEDV